MSNLPPSTAPTALVSTVAVIIGTFSSFPFLLFFLELAAGI
jgi:hypothetical protein